MYRGFFKPYVFYIEKLSAWGNTGRDMGSAEENTLEILLFISHSPCSFLSYLINFWVQVEWDMLLGEGWRGNTSPTAWPLPKLLGVPSWREAWPHTHVLRTAGDLQNWAGCGAGALVWQAVFEGRADADPSAFAKEVISPFFPFPCSHVIWWGVKGRQVASLHWVRNEQKPKLGAAGSLLRQGGVWLCFVQQHSLSRRTHRTTSI